MKQKKLKPYNDIILEGVVTSII